MPVRKPSTDLATESSAAASALPGGGAMGRLIRQKDWSATALGALQNWPQSLRTAVGICTESRFPMAIWWGPDAVQLYNDGYVPLLGAKHPLSLGQPGPECWAEIWNVLGPLYRRLMACGEVTYSDDVLLPMDRYGYTEETYLTFSCSPIRDESGGVGGMLITCAETTDRELLARVDSTLTLARVRREAEAAVRASEERYRAFIELVSDAVWRIELEQPVPVALPAGEQIERFYRDAWLAECNDAMAQMYGAASSAELVGARLGDLLPREDPGNLEYLRAFVTNGYRLAEAESHEIGRDGRPRYFLNNLYGIVQDGGLVRAWGSQRDITERRETTERLQRAQRMESVGKLAGGIAHEVNNMMSVVLGCSEFVLRRPDLHPTVRADIAQVRQAAERSAAITAQLLAFSRRQMLQPVALDVAAVVGELEPVLRRTLGENISLELRLGPVGAVLADRGQLQQVLVNLALNARDAMPRGGRLEIETAVVELTDDDAARHTEVRLRRGPHAFLRVTDTGHGMDGETASHVFEPFFTTKAVGKGTGLGLSVVYGIVKQSDGYVWVDSAPGRGATFRIYLPLVDAPVATVAAPPARTTAAAGRMVLVVEDEPLVRTLSGRVLEAEGYSVLTAESGTAALDLLERHAYPVSLVLTDVAMAGISGRELGRRLAEERPGVPVLYMSGHPADEAVRSGLLLEHQPFIQKPFTPDALAQAVRALLEGTVLPPVQE
jgi:signal transduction histidine kinase/CheY-like chemotaxis protein